MLAICGDVHLYGEEKVQNVPIFTVYKVMYTNVAMKRRQILQDYLKMLCRYIWNTIGVIWFDPMESSIQIMLQNKGIMVTTWNLRIKLHKRKKKLRGESLHKVYFISEKFAAKKRVCYHYFAHMISNFKKWHVRSIKLH